MSPKRKNRNPRTLSALEAATRYGYQRHWLLRLLKAGKLEGWKDGCGYWRVSVKAMAELLRKRQEREGHGQTPQRNVISANRMLSL